MKRQKTPDDSEGGVGGWRSDDGVSSCGALKSRCGLTPKEQVGTSGEDQTSKCLLPEAAVANTIAVLGPSGRGG